MYNRARAVRRATGTGPNWMACSSESLVRCQSFKRVTVSARSRHSS